MWTKTLQIKYDKTAVDVLVFLFDSTEDGSEIVRIQSMYNEFYLIEDISFSNRDSAHDFIEHYPKSMAKAFFIREGYNNGAID